MNSEPLEPSFAPIHQDNTDPTAPVRISKRTGKPVRKWIPSGKFTRRAKRTSCAEKIAKQLSKDVSLRALMKEVVNSNIQKHSRRDKNGHGNNGSHTTSLMAVNTNEAIDPLTNKTLPPGRSLDDIVCYRLTTHLPGGPNGKTVGHAMAEELERLALSESIDPKVRLRALELVFGRACGMPRQRLEQEPMPANWSMDLIDLATAQGVVQCLERPLAIAGDGPEVPDAPPAIDPAIAEALPQNPPTSPPASPNEPEKGEPIAPRL